MLVEFRHRSWLDDDTRPATLSWLESRGMTQVIVDAPKTEAKNLVPTVQALTSPTLYVRFHGRNAKTWNKRGGSAAERFDYLYADDELEEWVERSASWPVEPRTPTRSSTTTPRARGAAAASRRPRRTRRCCGGCSTGRACLSAGGLEPAGAAQRLF